MFVAVLKKSITLVEYLWGLLFIFLNVVDAWLTERLLANGGAEANPVVESYGASLAIKALLAVLVVAILGLVGKTRYLRLLNVGMLLIVVWTGGWLLTYL